MADLGTWFRRTAQRHAVARGGREVARFVQGLARAGDAEIGAVVAIATVLRLNLEREGILPEGLFAPGPRPDAETLGLYQLRLNHLAGQFRRRKEAGDVAGALIWSYTLRCYNVPELMPLGRALWAELKRGFPHVEEALRQGEATRGTPLPERAWMEWSHLPPGMEDGSASR